MKEHALLFDHLSFSYGRSPVLEDIHFSVEPQEFVGVIGPNGGGKTTLLRLILGQLAPQSGSVTVFGRRPVRARREAGYMPQYSTVNSAMPLTVEETVAMGLFSEGDLFPRISRSKRKRVDEILSLVGLSDKAHCYFNELSGGQKQRTLLARAVVSSPRLLLLDEPTSSVDYRAEKDIYDYLKQLSGSMSVVLVSHDISVVSTLVDKVVCLNRKAAVHSVKDVTAEMLGRELYNTEVGVVRHTCNL
ncbi:MAG: metal ABC transporter ATP-binding protein [Spirochaetota bacterium]